MLVIRHAEARDLDDILKLAKKSGVGLTSLPADRETLFARIERTQKTLQKKCPKSEQGYLFVLEDTQNRQVIGLSAIEVAVGLIEPFYNYHVGKQVHASKNLNVYKTLDTLFLSNDLTGSSELCTLFLDENYRKGQNGKFLSKIRFLFIAAFQENFEKKLIAEMRGYSEDSGFSPFWDALGNQFFSMDFAQADYLSGVGQKAFIAELMPRFPIYVDLLNESARNVIGKVHPQTQPASRLLQSEGMQYKGYVDIFDAGPTLEAEVQHLRAVKQSNQVAVKIDSSIQQTQKAYLITNDHYQDYRGILGYNPISDGYIILSKEQATVLNVTEGQAVRILSLNAIEES